VLGLISFFALLSLWIFSLFYIEGVVWEWPDGFIMIGFGSGTCHVASQYFASEYWSMVVNKKEAEDMREVCRLQNKEKAKFLRLAFTGDARIRNRWSLQRVCYHWLPSCTSRDEDDGYHHPSLIYRRTKELSLPFWMPITLIAAPTLWSFWRARERNKRGRCRKCLYDLTGNVSGICPECGTPIPAQVRMEVDSDKTKRGGPGFSEPGG
jgi:hypothetical protein